MREHQGILVRHRFPDSCQADLPPLIHTNSKKSLHFPQPIA